MGNDSYGIIDGWLSNIKKIRDENMDELISIKEEESRADRLSRIKRNTTGKKCGKHNNYHRCLEKERRPTVHGWIYGIKDGLIKPLLEIEPAVKQPAYTML